MAQPIPYAPTPRDPRAELHARLQSAPAEHAAALLSSLEVLQGLHDSGVLDLLRGALGSRDKVIEVAVAAAGAPASTRAIGNLVLLSKMLGEIDPAVLRALTRAAPQALATVVRHPEPPGLWRLVKDFLWNRDFRRGMAAVNAMLEALGRNLSRDAASANSSQPPEAA